MRRIFYIIFRLFHQSSNSTLNAINPYCTFNPINKWLEALDEIKRLNEKLIESEREKVALLERLLKK